MRTQDCLKIVSFLLLLASPALADTINYTFTVYESGVIGSHSFTDSLLTIHVVADNSHLIGNGTGIVPTQTATMTVDGITADLSIGKVFSSGQTPCDANTNWLPNNIPCVGVEVVGPAGYTDGDLLDVGSVQLLTPTVYSLANAIATVTDTGYASGGGTGPVTFDNAHCANGGNDRSPVWTSAGDLTFSCSYNGQDAGHDATFTATVGEAQQTPEPGTLALVGAPVAWALTRRRR